MDNYESRNKNNLFTSDTSMSMEHTNWNNKTLQKLLQKSNYSEYLENKNIESRSVIQRMSKIDKKPMTAGTTCRNSDIRKFNSSADN